MGQIETRGVPSCLCIQNALRVSDALYEGANLKICEAKYSPHTHIHTFSLSVYTVSKPVQTRSVCSLSPPHRLEEDKLAEESAKGIDLDHCGCLNSRYTISAKGP